MPCGSTKSQGESSPRQLAAWAVQSDQVFEVEAGDSHSLLGKGGRGKC